MVHAAVVEAESEAAVAANDARHADEVEYLAHCSCESSVALGTQWNAHVTMYVTVLTLAIPLTKPWP